MFPFLKLYILYHESEDNIDQILFDPITILHD